MTAISTQRPLPHAPGLSPCSQRPRASRPWALVLLSALLAALAANPADAQQALDRSMPVRIVSSPHREDGRTSLDQFGLRPTLVVVPCQLRAGGDGLEQHLQALSQVDKLAGRWSRAGGELVCLDPRFPVGKKPGEGMTEAIFRLARMKKTICVVPEEDPLAFVINSDIPQEHFAQPFTEDLEYRWVLLGEQGVITASGRDVFDAEVLGLLEELVEPQRGADRGTARGFDIISQWRLADAQKHIGKLQDKHPNEAELLQKLLHDTVASYRERHVTVLAQQKLLVEQAEVLTRMVQAVGAKTELGEQLAAELSTLQSAPGYAQAQAHRAIRDQALKVLSEAEAAVAAAYDLSGAGRNGYDELAFSKLVVDRYPVAIQKVKGLIGTDGGGPYRKELLVFLMDCQEDLEYAADVVQGGV